MKTKLTSRELDIIEYLLSGATNMDIANKFYLSPHTVKTIMENILKKLKLKNRVQVVVWALREGLFK